MSFFGLWGTDTAQPQDGTEQNDGGVAYAQALATATSLLTRLEHAETRIQGHDLSNLLSMLLEVFRVMPAGVGTVHADRMRPFTDRITAEKASGHLDFSLLRTIILEAIQSMDGYLLTDRGRLATSLRETLLPLLDRAMVLVARMLSTLTLTDAPTSLSEAEVQDLQAQLHRARQDQATLQQRTSEWQADRQKQEQTESQLTAHTHALDERISELQRIHDTEAQKLRAQIVEFSTAHAGIPALQETAALAIKLQTRVTELEQIVARLSQQNTDTTKAAEARIKELQEQVQGLENAARIAKADAARKAASGATYLASTSGGPQTTRMATDTSHYPSPHSMNPR